MSNKRKALSTIVIAAMLLLILLSMFGCAFTDNVVRKSQDKADAQATDRAWGEEWQRINSGNSSIPVPTKTKIDGVTD